MSVHFHTAPDRVRIVDYRRLGVDLAPHADLFFGDVVARLDPAEVQITCTREDDPRPFVVADGAYFSFDALVPVLDVLDRLHVLAHDVDRAPVVAS